MHIMWLIAAAATASVPHFFPEKIPSPRNVCIRLFAEREAWSLLKSVNKKSRVFKVIRIEQILAVLMSRSVELAIRAIRTRKLTLRSGT